MKFFHLEVYWSYLSIVCLLQHWNTPSPPSTEPPLSSCPPFRLLSCQCLMMVYDEHSYPLVLCYKVWGALSHSSLYKSYLPRSSNMLNNTAAEERHAAYPDRSISCVKLWNYRKQIPTCAHIHKFTGNLATTCIQI